MTRRHLLIGAQAAGTAVLLWLLFRVFDWASFAAVLRHMPTTLYVGSLVAVAAGQALYALRWRVVLGGMGVSVPYADVLRQYVIGLFFSNLMPTSIGGDAAKVYYLGRVVGYVEAGASVVVDRTLGFLWLATFGATLAWAADTPSSLFALNRTLLSLFAVGFIGLLALVSLGRVDRLVRRLGGHARQAWVERAQAFIGCARASVRQPATLLTSGVVVITYVLLLTLVYERFFRSAGVTPPPARVAGVIISLSIFANVPISVNGIGLREQLHYLLFAALGVPKEVAVSISLLVFAHMLLLSLAGYIVWLRADRTPAPRTQTSAT